MKLKVGDVVWVDDGNKMYIGEIQEIDGPHTLTLCKASWVANAGRHYLFATTGHGGEQMEIEPHGTIMGHWKTVTVWPFPLFTEVI